MRGLNIDKITKLVRVKQRALLDQLLQPQTRIVSWIPRASQLNNHLSRRDSLLVFVQARLTALQSFAYDRWLRKTF